MRASLSAAATELTEVEPAEQAQSLPALIKRAGQRLLEAHTSAEILEAKKVAEAALHYAKVTKAANDTHADCVRIIARAEIRMANEIDRAQEAGQVARPGGDRQTIVQASDNGAATFSDLGVSRQRVAEWRTVRDAGEEVVEGAIQQALAEGRAPTKSGVLEAARGSAVKEAREKPTVAQIINAKRDEHLAHKLSRAEVVALNRLERFSMVMTNVWAASDVLEQIEIPQGLPMQALAEALENVAAAQRRLAAFAKRVRATRVAAEAADLNGSAAPIMPSDANTTESQPCA
jgi:hypothetical protein